MTDLMEEAPVGWFLPWNETHGYQQVARQHDGEPDLVPLYSASALAAAEQRGREEERQRLHAAVTMAVCNETLACQRRVAASIRRGDGTAPPSSPPEQNGVSATPSHAPEGET